MDTHAGERGGLAIATDRKDMGTCEVDRTSCMVHTSDISKRDKEIRSQDFYLEILPLDTASARAGSGQLAVAAGGEGEGPVRGCSDAAKGDASSAGPRSTQFTREGCEAKGQETETAGSGPDHVGLDQVKLVRNETVASHSSGSSSRWERATTMVRELMDKIMLLLGLVGPGMEEKMNGRPCHDRTAPQRGAQVAAAPHPHGRIRNPYHTNHGGMAWEERLSESQLGREHGSRHSREACCRRIT